MKKEIVNYAKNLFLEFNSQGKKKYTLRQIADKIQQKFTKKIDHTTVLNWSEKYNWNEASEKVKQSAIEKSKQKEQIAEHKIIDKKSNDLAETYNSAMNLLRIGNEILLKSFEKNEISTKDALQCMKIGTDIILKINDLNKETTDNITINVTTSK